MGCCGSTSGVSNPQQSLRSDQEYARRLQQQENQRAAQAGGRTGTQERQPAWSSAGTGHSLGGGNGSGADANLSPEERRQRALEAAEQRSLNVPGLSREKAAELRDKQQREELLGKLTEHYTKKRKDPPMGLNLASLEQLRQHWDAVRQGDSDAVRVLDAT
mmetsp:Transcript_121915/g.237100  ORF Transcript_121915/g.237100 Transcript_121915/m.237100 type:complete len:161 (+) Transcript_121915:78-560(+)